MRSQTRVSIFLIVLLASLLPACRDGEYGRSKTFKKVVLTAGEVHEGWYFAAGDQVLIQGTVNGDVYAAAGMVEVDGTVNGDLIVAGGQVTIGGTVTDDVRAAGGAVRVTGKIGKNVTVAGGSVVIAREGSIGKNLLAAGGSVEVHGTIGQDAKIGTGDLDVTGAIKGNVDAAVDQLNIRKGAAIGGNLTIFTRSKERISVDSGTVSGTTSFAQREKEEPSRVLGMRAARFWLRALLILSLLVTALVFTFLLPSQITGYGRALTQKLGWSAAWGIGVLLFTPLLALVLLCTVIGAPLGLLVFTMYFWFLYLSQLSLGLLIADKAFGLEGRKGWRLFGPIGLGILIVGIVWYIPILGLILLLASLILGTGALSIVLGEAWKNRRLPGTGSQPSAS